ncbi:MAG: hypothetical protein JNL39_12960 [Opitutaceae bacterium]|nr:hypothetical protein [Opitutaceae bacterium]
MSTASLVLRCPPALRRPTLLVFSLALSCAAALAQGGIRPGDGGGGVVIGPGGGGGGGGGGGVVINPLPGGGGGGIVLPPGGGGGFPGGGGGGGVTITPGPRIITVAGLLAGQNAQANVVIVAATGATTPAAATSTYQWTVSGGRIVGDPTRAQVTYSADTPGTLSLNVVVTANGVSTATSADVTVVAPTVAGSITAASTVATSTVNASLTASVPAATNNDRTFRWTLAGTGAAIASGQGTNTVTIRPGQPGLLEVMCDVTLQQLATVTLRSFVVVAGAGANSSITLINGAGGGTYPAGSRVDIFAHPPPPGQVFDRWTGDTALLGNAPIAALLPHTVVTVPTTPATLTATYRAAPTWTPTVVTGFNPITGTSPTGTTFTYHVPADARGLVFLLHGAGGAGADWFSSPEALLLARDLVAAGYGVAALSSANRTAGTWAAQATLATNPDAGTHAAALDRLAATGSITPATPVFFLGLGAGAEAAARFADLLATATPARPVSGVVLYNATGSDTLAVTSRVPQFFALAAHDAALGVAGNNDARNNSQLLAGRGVATGVFVNNASPVYATRFRTLALTNSSFTAADAQSVWAAVKAAGLLDANNYPRAVPSLDAVRNALPSTYQARAAEVQAQLAIGYAAQEFYSDANVRVINFLNARLANASAPPPGRLVNLSTRTRIAFLGDNFTLGFTIAGTQRATLLIRGIGPALRRFGLPGALLAPRLEVNRGNTVLAANTGWDNQAAGGPTPAQITAAAASVGAFPLAAGDLDTALLLQLDPGSYTAVLRGVNGSIGDVLAEVYDVSRNATRLTNLSTLARISGDGEQLVPGIVIAGNNPRTLMARAVAQGLVDFGLPAASLLGDARLSLLTNVQQGNQSVTQTVAVNNNWAQGGAAALNAVFPAVGAFPLRVASDAALLDAIAPGAYTLQADAAPLPPAAAALANPPNQTGTVLVEIYEVP